MNYDQHVAVSFQTGFEQRLQHLVTKAAMVKAAGGLAPMWRRLGQQAVARGGHALRPAARPGGGLFSRGVGGAVAGAGKVIREVPVARQTLRSALPSAGKLIRETPVASQFTRQARPPGASKVIRETPTPGAGGGAGKPPTPPTPPPGPAAAASPPPNAAPGTVTPDQMRQMGLVTTNRGFVGGPKPTIDVDATVTSGDPTGGLLGRIRNMLPGGARAWAERNPELYGGALGALGGGGAVMAGDQYGDWRRRRAIENLGLLDRLGLALQLAASPRGFNQTLGL